MASKKKIKKVKSGAKLTYRVSGKEGTGITCEAVSNFRISNNTKNKFVSVLLEGGETQRVRIRDLFPPRKVLRARAISPPRAMAEAGPASPPAGQVHSKTPSPSSKASSSSPKSPARMVLASLEVDSLALEDSLVTSVRKFETALVGYGKVLCHILFITYINLSICQPQAMTFSTRLLYRFWGKSPMPKLEIERRSGFGRPECSCYISARKRTILSSSRR